MNRATLVLCSLRFYRRTHLGVLAGCALSAAVLSGALFVGDSVRGSLERIALARLGKIDAALDTGNRYFRADLPARLKLRAAAALHVPGMALRGTSQFNRVEVLGVDGKFLALADSPADLTLPRDGVALNEKLAAVLGVKVGDEVALRLPKPNLLSRDAPLSARRERETVRAPFTVVAILTDLQLGRFSLKSDQAGPATAFVDLGRLQQMLDLEGAANLLAVASSAAEAAQAALRGVWTLEDAGIDIRGPRYGVVQVQSPRIYLDPAAVAAAFEAAPGGVGVLSYLVNAITAENGKSTPYSFMTAGPVPAGMKDDEILINRWWADRLSVKEGDRVEVEYSELRAAHEFVKKRRSFRVRGVVEMEALAAERDLAPQFPGLTDVDTCRNWEIDLPLDEKNLDDKENEEYWKKHKQTPKALVTLAAGREMWANPFGDLMAVRFPVASTDLGGLREALKARMDPAAAGLLFRPVREQALKAARESMDLGQLFLGMSLFLVAASLLLTAMLFVFSAEQRAREMGVLRAVGHSSGQVRGQFLGEGLALAALGSLAGVPLGWAYARGLIGGLGGAWSGAVAGTPVEFHASAASAVAGAGAAAAISLLAMAWALRRQAKRPPRELLSEDFSLGEEERSRSKRPWDLRGVLVACLVGAAAVAGTGRGAAAFFAAGALMLAGGMALVRMILARAAAVSPGLLSTARLGTRNAARRPGRGLAAAGMLACGAFMVLSVSAMKEDLSLQAGVRRSGTGGFELYGESSTAIHHDLNDRKGRAALKLADEAALEGVSVLPIKVREGDDASCVNLNLSLTPPLLGVDPVAFARLDAFADAESWKLLETPQPDGAVPALVGDAATALWKLKKKVGKMGDLLDYRDERGREFKVRLVGQLPYRLSVLQGRLLISGRDFLRLYPSESGYRMFLLDVPPGRENAVSRYLTAKLDQAGLELVPSVERLREFYVVEGAYLSTFLVLGGLGLLLGTAGLGILVLRNVLERRAELALLRAVGYTPAQAAGVVLSEHRFLVLAGLVAGAASATLAIAPSVARPEVHVPYGLMAAFLLGTLLLSLGWIGVAARLALRAPLVSALRNE